MNIPISKSKILKIKQLLGIVASVLVPHHREPLTLDLCCKKTVLMCQFNTC